MVVGRRSYPNRLQQVSWTNPLTNRILLEAGVSVTTQRYNTTEHRQYTNPTAIPRVKKWATRWAATPRRRASTQFAGLRLLRA